ncbi:MAG TPA: TIGR03067 domain-containing protein [Gemmatimonadales bacterium]|jgi:uncharacterized protein (TIGR03067 family)|nr:TIGR03067 domain-containing protein [Gemmatimonadales bacterium]
MRLLLIPLSLSLIVAPLRAQDEASADQGALQGDWTMVSASINGATYPNSTGTRHVAGDTTTVTVNGTVLMSAIFTLNPSTQPKSVDYAVIGGSLEGQHLLGIYRLEDSTLTFCITGPGGVRPTEFATTAGDGRTCSEWKRQP